MFWGWDSLLSNLVQFLFLTVLIHIVSFVLDLEDASSVQVSVSAASALFRILQAAISSSVMVLIPVTASGSWC